MRNGKYTESISVPYGNMMLSLRKKNLWHWATSGTTWCFHRTSFLLGKNKGDRQLMDYQIGYLVDFHIFLNEQIDYSKENSRWYFLLEKN